MRGLLQQLSIRLRGQRALEPTDRLVLHSADDLAHVARLIEQQDASVAGAAALLKKRADALLASSLIRITDKQLVAPTGDPRDYCSIGTYWWPNPETSDGLPYIRRDGQVNPESMDSDTGRVRQMCRQVLLLALAWRLFRDERHAIRAAEQLRVWFLDPGHAMTPHLNYAQCIPGRSAGRSYGVIDTRGFRYLVDSATLLLDSPAWSVVEQAQLRSWMLAFLDWLVTSSAGRKERRAANNHGTWYNAQALALALFCGDARLADELARQAQARIEQQISPDGLQPEEYRRSRPLTYCTMNLWAFCELATLSERTSVDLWSHEASSGSSLKQAAYWLLPFLQRREPWPEREIVSYQPENYLSMLRRLALRFGDLFEPARLPLDQKRVLGDLMQLQYPAGLRKETVS